MSRAEPPFSCKRAATVRRGRTQLNSSSSCRHGGAGDAGAMQSHAAGGGRSIMGSTAAPSLVLVQAWRLSSRTWDCGGLSR